MDTIDNTIDNASRPITPEELEALLAIQPGVAVTEDTAEPTEADRVLN